MQRSEASPSAELLSDLGNSEVRTAGGDNREHELLRLASDPLLLNKFVKRDAADVALRRTACPVAQGLVQSMHTAKAGRLVSRRREFDAFSKAVVPSLLPEIFVPSDADRALPTEGNEVGVTNRLRCPALLVSGALLILCGALLLALI